MFPGPAGSNNGYNNTALPENAFVVGQTGNRRRYRLHRIHKSCDPIFAFPRRCQNLTDEADATEKGVQTPGQDKASRDARRLGAGVAVASAACAVSLAGLTTLAPGASAVELSRGHQLTVERELLEGLILDNAQSKLRSLSDDDLLTLFRDVVTGKAPSVREPEPVKERTFLSRLSPFRGSSQSQQQPTEPDFPGAGGEPVKDRGSSDEFAKQSGAQVQLQPEGTIRQTQGKSEQGIEKDKNKEEKRGPSSVAQPAVGSSSSQIGDVAVTGGAPEREGAIGGDDRSEATADPTAALLESSGVVLPPESSEETPESARQQGAGASIVRGGLGAAASIAQGVGGALVAAAVALQRSSVAAPAISLAGLVALIYIFFRIITSEEDEEEGQTESRAREGPEEDSKLPTAEKAAGWRKTPPEALEKLGLKPPTETPESLRQLPALSFLSRLVRLEGDESAGTTPTAQESRSHAKLPSGADVGNAVARESGEKPERDQAVKEPQRIAPQASQKLRPPVGQPMASLSVEAQQQADEAVLWRRRRSVLPLNGVRDAATLDRPDATPSAQARPTAGPQDIATPAPGPVLWQRRAQSYPGGAGRPSSSAKQRLRSERRGAESDPSQRGREIIRTRAAAAPAASSLRQRTLVLRQGSPAFGRNDDADESSKHGRGPAVGDAPASAGRPNHAQQAEEKGIAESSLHITEGAPEPSRSTRGVDQEPQATTRESRVSSVDESVGGTKQAAGSVGIAAVAPKAEGLGQALEGSEAVGEALRERIKAEESGFPEKQGLSDESRAAPVTQTAGPAALPVTAQSGAVVKTFPEGSDAVLLEPSVAEGDHSRSDAEGGGDSFGPMGTQIRWPQQGEEVIGVVSSTAAWANGPGPLGEVNAVGFHDRNSPPADVQQPAEGASGRGSAPLSGDPEVVRSSGNSAGDDEAGEDDSASWRGFLTDGSLGTEDEACFPRQQDRDAFRLKQAHRRRKQRPF